MEFRILGPLEVVENGQALDLGGQKQRALLAVLLLHPGQVVSTERLIDALWAEEPPETGRKALQVYVSQLRKLVGRERIETRPPGYCLHLNGGELDLVPLLEEGLSELGEEAVELRARLLARLAGASRDEHSRERRDALSGEAVALARRTGNPNALTYALDGRAAAIFGPDAIADCLALGSELIEVAEGVGDAEQVAHGLFHRLVAQIPLGNISEAKTDLERMSAIASELRDPAQLWQICAVQAMLALAEGRFDEGEQLREQALTLGERAMGAFAIPAHRLQSYTLCDLRGELDDVESTMLASAAEYPARPVFRCALAHLYARLGRTDAARRELDELAAEDCAALPFDIEWLLSMSLLAETCTRLHDRDAADVLYRLLAPYGPLNAADTPEGIRGSISRYLGLLAAALERWGEAARHFEDALVMNARMGALPWLAHTQFDYGQMLAERGEAKRAFEFVAAAEATYRELGMESRASPTRAS